MAGPAQRAVEKVLIDAAGKGMTTEEIATIVGITKNGVRNVLYKLMHDGVVSRTGKSCHEYRYSYMVVTPAQIGGCAGWGWAVKGT